MKYDLSIIMPGIRKEHWHKIWAQTQEACRRYSCELIIVSPYFLPPELQGDVRVKFIRDFGTPTRCFHLGTMMAEGRFLTWFSDDAWIYPNSLDESLDLLMSKNPEKDLVGMRYSEGENHSGQCPPDNYWITGTHADLRQPGIDPNYRVCGVLMLDSEYYQYMGGLDCKFHHINFNVHDFAIRAQNNGSKLYMSPNLIMNCDFESQRTPDNSPVIAAYFENDLPLFKKIYSNNSRPIRIDPDNWKESDPIWKKRF